MAFSVKDWQDSLATPISAAALEDLEDRLADYTDSGDLASVSLLPVASGRNEIAPGNGVVGLRLRPGGTSAAALEVFNASETQPRVQVTPDGLVKLGPGDAATDVVLSRPEAKHLRLAGYSEVLPAEGSGRLSPALRVYASDTGAPSDASANPLVHINHSIQRTDLASGLDFLTQGFNVLTEYGTQDGTATKGVAHSTTVEFDIYRCGDNTSEFACQQMAMHNLTGAASGGDGANPGRMWLTDWLVHGPIGVQPAILSGLNLVIDNYYNGSPSVGPSHGIHVTSMPSAGAKAAHASATTYPVDYGILVTGLTTGSAKGFQTALGIGSETGGGTWNQGSLFNRGVHVRDWQKQGLLVETNDYSGTAAAIEVISNGSSWPAYGLKLGGPGVDTVPDSTQAFGTFISCQHSDGTERFRIGGNGEFDFLELADQDNPPADTARMWARDNGSGSTQLCVRFPTGATQVIAQEGAGVAVKTFRTVHTFALKGTVTNTDTVPTFFVGEASGQAASLVSARYKIRSGSTVTFRLLKNAAEFGYGTTGSPLSAATSAAETNSTQALAEDDEIELDLVGGGTATDMTVTLVFEHVV